MEKRIKGRLRAAIVATVAVLSAVPASAHANVNGSGIVDAATLGVSAPNAQQIQQEVQLVQSQGVDIRVISHSTVATMAVLVAGRQVLVANVPVVEFQIGSSRGGTPTTGAATASSDTSAHATLASPMSARTAARAADFTYHWSWQDTVNGSAGGYPLFYFTAHYNQACVQGACTDTMINVTHEGDHSTQGDFLDGTFYAISCSNSYPGFGPGGGTSWQTEYSTVDSTTCAQNSTYIWSEGEWDRGGSIYYSYFNNKNTSPDFIRY